MLSNTVGKTKNGHHTHPLAQKRKRAFTLLDLMSVNIANINFPFTPIAALQKFTIIAARISSKRILYNRIVCPNMHFIQDKGSQFFCLVHLSTAL